MQSETYGIGLADYGRHEAAAPIARLDASNIPPGRFSTETGSMHKSGSSSASLNAREQPRRVLAAIGRGPNALVVVRAAAELARTLQCPWEAVHVATPDAVERADGAFDAAEALKHAGELGAAVARIPAAGIVDGLLAHLDSSPATDLVLGANPKTGWRAQIGRRLSPELIDRRAAPRLHLILSAAPPARGPRRASTASAASAPDYLKAIGAILVTALLALLLRPWLSTGALSLLFLFPVIGVSAWFGIRPGLVATVLSALLTNFLLVEPRFGFNFAAPQSWVLLVVLGLVAAHTGFMTSELRKRVALSDRNARENANLAAFALNLTRVSDWKSTGEVVCSEVSDLMGGIQTVLVREVGGELKLVSSHPAEPVLSPVDTAALEWAWRRGEESGSGTKMLADANWQFQPLRTSLGTMAILGLAREDGRDPVRADQAVLLSTLVAQAALAHERLRLEDEMRGIATASADRPGVSG